jgi:hypothetical protein
MKLKIAIIAEDGRRYVEFDQETFRELLRTYFKKTKDIDKAMDQIILELKNQTKYS